MSEPAPPWIVFPNAPPQDPPTQGAEEAFIDLEWLPFWNSMERLEKEDYLNRWYASPEWRQAIAERYDVPTFDVEADARESEEWQQNAIVRHPSFWSRLFRRD